MAEHIQGELRLIHEMGSTSPTKDEKPTNPTLGSEEKTTENPSVDPETKDSKNIKKLMSASVNRRAANLVIKMAEGHLNRQFDRRIFAESFRGNSRGATKIQNQKANTNTVINKAKQISGTAVTVFALGGLNPVSWALIGLQAATILVDYMNEFQNYKMQLEQYNMNREKEIFSTRYQRDRLNFYNRRRG